MSETTLVPRKLKKKILSILRDEFGIEQFEFEIFKSGKRRLWICTKDLAKLDLRGLRLHSIGFYFGELDDNLIRLSFDATQVFAKKIKKNIIEVNDEQAKAWFEGYDIKIPEDIAERYNERYVVLKYKDDFIGCGKVKNGKVWNYVPKDRRQEKDIDEYYDVITAEYE
ncbi:MAG: methyltransferase RsmF C-terminal domain-like protein [Candidatus Asgardarchaeia archaeon]